MAQGMVSEIKIVAVQKTDSLAPQAEGYSGANDFDLDFRKGRGGGYVFAIFKKDTNPNLYITDVRVEKRDLFGVEFDADDKKFFPAPYFQAHDHYDKSYRGGLNGRNYSIYGGAYPKQDHVYISRTGNQDFSKRVLKSVEVKTSKPSKGNNQTISGGHAGGGRYFLFTWHTHESKYKPLPSRDITTHEHYCDTEGCKLTKQEPHNFDKVYGVDAWFQFVKTADDQRADSLHYKKCLDCGQIVYNQPVTVNFDLKNKGGSQLVIKNVRTSCGCTKADYPRKPIASGEDFTVTATYDARQLGHFYKQIALYSNASTEPYYLTLKGVVVDKIVGAQSKAKLQEKFEALL